MKEECKHSVISLSLMKKHQGLNEMTLVFEQLHKNYILKSFNFDHVIA